MKIQLISKIAAGFALALTLGSCADEWNDHYDVTQSGDAATLWQAIEQDSQLSNFATVLKATGYDKTLASSQVLTVFAPTNDHFSAEQAQQLIAQFNEQNMGANKRNLEDNQTMKEFVRNHIALFNRSVIEGKTETIKLLNGKYVQLSPEMVGNSHLLNGNELYANGLLFKIDAPTNYIPNLFEALTKTEGTDSVGAFFESYNKYYFDASQSVEGNINEQGQTEYLDSVKVLMNAMMYNFGRLNNEDSSYVMVVPTNDEWNRLVAKYEPYYKYSPIVPKADSLTWAIPRQMVLWGSTFSKSFNHEWASMPDSAYSTNAKPFSYRMNEYGYDDVPYCVFDKPYDQGGIFNGATESTCSNGTLYVSDHWNIDPMHTFVYRVMAEGENTGNITDIEPTTTRNPEVVNVQRYNPFYDQISRHKFVQLLPAGKTVHSATFNIENTLSNMPYDLYVVFAPYEAADTAATEAQCLPTKVRCKLDYQDMEGKWLKKPIEYKNIITTPHIVDEKLIAEGVTFPACAFGSNIPQVKLTITCDVRNSEETKGIYTRNIFIDCIKLVPHIEN